MSPTRWIVTGASGLIGRALVARLLADGQRVTALSRSAERFFGDHKHARLEAKNYDLSVDAPDRLGAPDGDTALVMLGANITTSLDLHLLPSLMAVDVYGHLRLAQWAGPQLVYGLYASSCTVYGWRSASPVDEAAPPQPQTPYALCKVAAEVTLGELFATRSLPLTALRIAQVYGPGAAQGGALYNFLKAAVAGQPPRISCQPDAVRDYAHIDDIADGAMAAMKARCAGVYNLGGAAVAMDTLARVCLEVAGSHAQPDVKPDTTTWSMHLDCARAQRAFGYLPARSIRRGVESEHRRLYASAPPSCSE